MISKNMNKRNNNLLLELKYFEIINIGRNDKQPTPMGLKCLGKGPGGRDMVWCRHGDSCTHRMCSPYCGTGVEMVVAKLFLFITTINLIYNSF